MIIIGVDSSNHETRVLRVKDCEDVQSVADQLHATHSEYTFDMILVVEGDVLIRTCNLDDDYGYTSPDDEVESNVESDLDLN